MESHEVARERFGRMLPILREEVGGIISSLSGLIRETNPLELLSRVSFNNLVASEKETDTDLRSEAKPEYVLSLALSQPFPTSPVDPTPEQIQECFDLVDSLFLKATMFYGGKKAMEGDPDHPESELLSDLVVNTLHVRGDGFYHHMRERFEKVAEPHDEFFLSHFGFALGDYHEFLDRIEEEMNRKIEVKRQENLVPFQRLLSKIEAEIARIPEPKNQEEHRKRYDEEIGRSMEKFDAFASPEIFRIDPLTETDSAILECLSMRFGENAGFLEGIPKWPGWPLNPTGIFQKPFIKCDDQFYLFHLQMASRESFRIFDSLAETVDSHYRNHKFLKSRDDFTESEAVMLLSQALPGAEIYQGLKYTFSDSEDTKEGEVDGVLIYDDNLIIVEAKAHGLSSSARRGGPERLIRDLKKSLDESHNQANRLLDALDSQALLELRDERGRVVLKLDKRDFLRNFMVSASFDLLPIVGAKLPSLRKMGLIRGAEWPWVVSLDDLRVAVDLLDRPSVFLHYLLRRSQLNELPKVQAMDELDYLTHYVHSGLFFEENQQYAEADSISIGDHTQDLTQYYRRITGGSEHGKKPKVPLSGSVKRFLDLMEKHQPKHFTSATLCLLGFDSPARDELLSSMNKQIKKLRREERGAFAGLKGNEKIPALYTSVVPNLEKWGDWAEKRCLELIEKYGIQRCVLVILTVPIAAGDCEVRVLSGNESESHL